MWIAVFFSKWYICVMSQIDYLWDGDKWIKSTDPGIKPIKLDLPPGYSKFKFYSKKGENGYYLIFEGQSGIPIVNEFSKKLTESKERGEYMIKTHTKDAAAFQKLINDQKKKVTAAVKKAFNTPKPGSKKLNPKLDAMKKAKPPGKRVSTSGKVYYESRVNKSDQKGKKI